MFTYEPSHRAVALRIAISSAAIVSMTLMTLVQSWQLSIMVTSAEIVPMSYYMAKIVSIVTTFICIAKLTQILRIDVTLYRGA